MDDKIKWLKANLCLLDTDDDTTEYLFMLLRTAEEELRLKGITDDGGDAYGNLQVMYASWLYQKRKSESNDPMPTALQYAIRNAYVRYNTAKGLIEDANL